jgi:hypothetical protein
MKAVLFFLTTVWFVVNCEAGSDKEDWTAMLHKALDGATRLRIRSGGTCHRRLSEEKTLLDVGDAKEIAKVIQQIRIDANHSGFHCMCCGNPTLEFYRADTLLLSLGFHHAQSMRWPDGKWKGDGLLTKGSADFLVKWFTAHGIRGPQEQVEESLRLQKKAEASHKKWLSAMPSSLKPFWGTMGDPMGTSKTAEMQAALSKQLPDEKERILALLKWFGSGEGPWSGFPSYETVAEELLLLHATGVIIGAIRDRKLTEQQVEGAARLFGGWDFYKRRPNEIDLVPEKLKQQFLEHSLKCKNEDKKERARHAFEAKRGAGAGK